MTAHAGGERAALRAVRDVATIDLTAAQVAAAALLRALGMSDRDGMRATPARMARAYAELCTPYPFALSTFPNDEGYDELVPARAIAVRSVCEHHLLPFTGVACVGYLPGERILGSAKLARVVEQFRRTSAGAGGLTKQVADRLDAQLGPKGVGVVIEAEHSRMTLRGVRAAGSSTVTSTLVGTRGEDSRSRAEFSALAGVAR